MGDRFLDSKKNQTNHLMRLHSSSRHTSGTVLMWLGFVLCVAAIVWFYLSGRAIGYSEIITSKNENGTLTKNFVHGVALLGWKERLVYLLPFVPGVILIISGWCMRHTNHGLRVNHLG